MKSKHLIIFLIGLAVSTTVSADTVDRSSDDTAIREIFVGLTKAWKDGDGKAWGSAFLPDADFTVWFGLQLQGQEAIAQGHQFIFDHFYKDTSYELSVKKIRYLADGAAVVHLAGTVIKPSEPLPKEPDSVPLAVVQKVTGKWKIAAFQNTPFAVEQYGRNGDLRKFKGRLKPDE